MLYKFPLSSLSILQPATTTTTATNPPAGVRQQQCKLSMLYMCNNLLLLLLQTKTKSMSAELSTLLKFALIAVVVFVAATAAVDVAALFMAVVSKSPPAAHA